MTSTYYNFHTIKSILNFKTPCNIYLTLFNFHTIKSILNHNAIQDFIGVLYGISILLSLF